MWLNLANQCVLQSELPSWCYDVCVLLLPGTLTFILGWIKDITLPMTCWHLSAIDLWVQPKGKCAPQIHCKISCCVYNENFSSLV